MCLFYLVVVLVVVLLVVGLLVVVLLVVDLLVVGLVVVLVGVDFFSCTGAVDLLQYGHLLLLAVSSSVSVILV